MHKQYHLKKLAFLFVLCVLTIACTAQVYGEEETESGPPKPRPRGRTQPIKPAVQLFSLKLQGNHDFYLVVDDDNLGKISKEKVKAIKLDADVHKLVFEEADSTGERIEHYIRVTKDMTKRDSLFTINFKRDYLDIIQPTQTALPSNSGQRQR